MAHNPKVAAVIVTYNNISMLKVLLEDLLHQTRKPDEIIVVDNASHDTTGKILTEEFSDVIYFKLPENTGSAGGYHEGIKIALENNNDLILTLDDDVTMPEDALEELLKGLDGLEKDNNTVGAVRAAGEGHVATVPTSFSLFAWRGTLIKSDAILKVGLPIKEFFIYGEDLEYALRMSVNGYSFFWIPGSKIMERRPGGKRWYSMFGKKHFYYGDNFRLYYAFRNEVYIFRKYRCPSRVFRTVLYGMKVILMLVIRERLKASGGIKAVVQGLFDGFRSNLGINPKYTPANIRS